MRCSRYAALDCQMVELCEIMGCQAGVPQLPAAPVPPPPSVSLNALERLAVRLHDKIDALGRKPVPAPEAPTMEDVLSEIRTVLSEPLPAPSPPPPRPAAPAPPAKARKIEVVSVPAGGWVFVEANAPVAVALDEDGAGRALASLLRA